MRQYRHELKFMINKSMAKALQQKLKLVMTVDQNYYNSDGTYIIRSLYFDDDESSSYYEKLDGVLHRKKYRIRIYNYDDSVIKLECKHKDDSYTLKRSTSITREDVEDLISGNIDHIKTDNELLKELVLEMKLKRLKPSVIVDYRRLAFTYPVSEVRVTFDYQVSSGYNNYDIFDRNATSISTIDDKELVLEVKFNDILPSHIALLLQSVPTVRQAFSKFAVCRSMKE